MTTKINVQELSDRNEDAALEPRREPRSATLGRRPSEPPSLPAEPPRMFGRRRSFPAFPLEQRVPAAPFPAPKERVERAEMPVFAAASIPAVRHHGLGSAARVIQKKVAEHRKTLDNFSNWSINKMKNLLESANKKVSRRSDGYGARNLRIIELKERER